MMDPIVGPHTMPHGGRDLSECTEVNGVPISVSYPSSGNIREHILSILSGQEYPVIPIVDFNPALIVDIGANVGASSLFFAAHYPAARVICFEPSLSNLGYLRRNTGASSMVEIRPVGLSTCHTSGRLFQGKYHCMGHSLFRNLEVTEDSELVELRDAHSELVGQVETPWLVKIDVEGAELIILQSLRALFSRIGVLYLEYHSEDLRRSGDRLLSKRFALWYSSAMVVHRGTAAYVAKSMLTGTDELSKRAITPC